MNISGQRSFNLIVIASLFLLTFACSKESSKPPEKTEAIEKQPASSSVVLPASPAGEGASSGQEDSAVTKIITRKWTGDLDGMIERRQIRVLTVYSKTNFFMDGPTQHGLTYEAFQLFEEDLNKQLNNKNVRVHVVIVPVAHDDLIPALLEGRGDIVTAGKLITEWRREQVDFTNPTRSNVSSIVVTGPGAPPIKEIKDLVACNR